MNNQNELIGELLSTAAAAKILGVATATLRYNRRTGKWKIPVVKVGRLHKYSRKDLEAFIDSKREVV